MLPLKPLQKMLKKIKFFFCRPHHSFSALNVFTNGGLNIIRSILFAVTLNIILFNAVMTLSRRC
jgi:hypothetical protein